MWADWYRIGSPACIQQHVYWSTRNVWRIYAFFSISNLDIFWVRIYITSNLLCRTKRKNREPAQPMSRSQRQPTHHDWAAAANPKAQSAPITIDSEAPAYATTMLSSEQFKQVSQAVGDILDQNQTQPIPIEPLHPSIAGHYQCAGTVPSFLTIDFAKLLWKWFRSGVAQ